VLTPEEIGAVPLFAGLGEAELAQLSRAAADLHLSAGEAAAEAGSERALFAVIEGRIEAVRIAERRPAAERADAR
jgi:thioredoxin reductase (NADPH)